MTARNRIDDDAAADGRLATEDDAVAASCDDRHCEPELSEALPCANDPRRHGRGSVVDVEARPVRDRRELLECDVEPVARCERPPREQRVASPELVPLHARECHGDSLAGVGALDRAVVHLDAAHADVAPAGLGSKEVAGADRSRPERPCRDRPDPAQREHAIDVEARRVVDTGVEIVFL